MLTRTKSILAGGLLAALILSGGAAPAVAAESATSAPGPVASASLSGLLDAVETAQRRVLDKLDTVVSSRSTSAQKRQAAVEAADILRQVGRQLGGRAEKEFAGYATTTSKAASNGQYATAAKTMRAAADRLGRIAQLIRDHDWQIGG